MKPNTNVLGFVEYTRRLACFILYENVLSLFFT